MELITDRIPYVHISYSIELTFFENIFCSENPIVAINALIKPIKSKEISVTVAMATPVIIGIRDKYTWKNV
jgi:hypothetical protein